MSLYPASFDDNDPTIIYSGSGWDLVTEDGEWRGTMHSTSVTGSWARVRFTGSRIAVICTIPTGDGSLSQARFQIDSGPAQYAAHRTTPPVQWQTTFWDSGPLSMGSHLLTITNAGNEAYFRMDRIDYDPTDRNAPLPRPQTTNPPPQQTTASRPVTNQVTRTSDDSRPETTSRTTSVSQSSSDSTVPPAPTNFANNTGLGTILSGTTTEVAGSTTSVSSDTNLKNLPSGDLETSGSSKEGLSITGILSGVFGGILFLIFVGSIIFFLLRRRRRRGNFKTNSYLMRGDDTPKEGGSTTELAFLGSEDLVSDSRRETDLLMLDVERSSTPPSTSLNPLRNGSILVLPRSKERLAARNATPESRSTSYAGSSGVSMNPFEAGDVGVSEYQSTSSPSVVNDASSHPHSVASGLEYEAPPAYVERASRIAPPVEMSGNVKRHE